MTETINSQAYIFLCSIAGGMLIAFIYDIFRIARKAFRTANLVTYAEDLLFWLIVAVVMFATVYYSNDGELRGYLFLGTVIGAVIYGLLLSRAVVASSLAVINIIKKIIKLLITVVIYPISIIYKALSIPGRKVKKQMGRSARTLRGMGRNGLSKLELWRKSFRNIRKNI